MTPFELSTADLSRVAAAPRSGVERVAKHAFLLCTVLSVALSVALVGVVAVETARFFAEVSPLRFFGDFNWTPLAEEPGFGVLSLLAGTAQIAAGATFFALPAGLATAVFLQHYTGRRTASVLSAVVAGLASIPAVILGYFALNFVTPALRGVWPGVEAFNGLSACLVVGLMILPTIVTLSRDALGAVPASLLDEAVALGATKGRALLRLVLPAASMGIAGSVVLAMGRAIGETVIVTLAAGNPTGLTWNPLEGVRTLTTFLAQISMGDLPPGTVEYGSCFAVAAFLFLLTYGMHAAGRRLAASGPWSGSRGIHS